MKNSLIVTFLLLAACVPLTGCSETYYEQQMTIAKIEKEKHPELKVFDGEEEPTFPDLKENRQSINGIDTNKNGIRDDVEIWINRTYKDKALREQAKKFVKSYFTQIRISKDGDVMELMDSSKISRERIEMEQSQKHRRQVDGCIFYLKYSHEQIRSFYKNNVEMVFNTKERKDVDMKIGQITSAIRYKVDPKKEDCSI